MKLETILQRHSVLEIDMWQAKKLLDALYRKKYLKIIDKIQKITNTKSLWRECSDAEISLAIGMIIADHGHRDGWADAINEIRSRMDIKKPK